MPKNKTMTAAVEVIDAPARHDWSDGSVMLDENWSREFVFKNPFGLKVHDLAIDAEPDDTTCHVCSERVGWVTSGDEDKVSWTGLILALRYGKPIIVLCEDCGSFLTD